ncbi:Lectin_legB domain-containing protein [Cephalotus follicularis]|uniref:Lectin_legB domain-containing protein n=1 Tax=Cephalotus follicularis TaxID=3775 RepID=A0A1Q3BCE3_CEPFO|nr:Lectin_legB domain-containing protein [Cephalotus follicularis]
MAILSILRYLTTATVLVFHCKTLSADQDSSFAFKRFGKDPNFEANIALYGDAKVVNGGSSVQLTNSVSSSAGRVMYKKPIKFVEGNPRKSASFSTYFSFSLSREAGDGLAFVMVPSGFDFKVFGNSSFGLPLGLEKSESRVLAVEFDSLKDAKYDDLNGNHVGIDMGSLVSVKVSNLSSVNLVLNNGEKLQSWIDYEASSKRLEVRLSQFGDTKPIDPLLSYSIDLSKLWNDEGVFVCLSSSNRNSSQTCFAYSWSFKVRSVPHWMHSEPLNPEVFVENKKSVVQQKRSDCFLRVLTALLFGTACGALGAFTVMYLCTIFASRRPIVPKECSVHPVEFEYKKVKVVVDKAIEDGK